MRTLTSFLSVVLVFVWGHLLLPDCFGSILYGVTGDGAKVPETLFELSQTDGSAKFVLQLGRGNDGEAIAFNPNDGCLYHASGGDDVIFERISPNGTITDIPLTNIQRLEVGAITWNPATATFLWSTLGGPLQSVAPDGFATALPGDSPLWKGLAFVGSELKGVISRSDGLYPIVAGSGIPQIGIQMSLPGYTITDGNGLAVDPDTGQLWGILSLGGSLNRHLVKIDPASGAATDVGSLGDKFAGIAFASHPVPEPAAAAMFWAASTVLASGRWRRPSISSRPDGC